MFRFVLVAFGLFLGAAPAHAIFYLVDCQKLRKDSARLQHKAISRKLLRHRSKRYLGLLRNALFARSHCRFRTRTYRDFFRNRSWYRPKASAGRCTHRRLNPTARRNARLLWRRSRRVSTQGFEYLCRTKEVVPKDPVPEDPPPSTTEVSYTPPSSPPAYSPPDPTPTPRRPLASLSLLQSHALSFKGLRYCLISNPDIRYCLDCSKLVQVVYRRMGYRLPRTASKQYLASSPVSHGRYQIGDLIFFSSVRGGRVKHVGIVISRGRVIHAVSGRGVIVDKLRRWAYGRKSRGVYFLALHRILSSSL